MKKFLFVIMASVATLAASAQFVGNGFYRVQNAATKRYIQVLDNRGNIEWQANEIDLGAMRTKAPLAEVISDPSTIIYAIDYGDENFDLQAQGTGVYIIIGQLVKVKSRPNDIYWCYGTKAGITKYLKDVDIDPDAGDIYNGQLISVTDRDDNCNWQVKGLNLTDNYFGLQPKIEVGGKHYMSFYASFPFAFTAEGSKAYYINKVDNELKVAVVAEISGGLMPSATPMIIETASDNVADNKLDIKSGEEAAVSGNLLTGVYFQSVWSAVNAHNNYVTYDESTMRVLGKTSAGKLGFIKANNADLKYNKNGGYALPANRAYLTVTTDAPDELTIMTEDEYKILAGIRTVTTSARVSADDAIYDLQGRRVSNAAANGIYIINGKKVVIK